MGNIKSNTETVLFKLIQPKQVIRFLCLFVFVYLLLMAPWPGLKAAYSKSYKAGSAFLFKSFGAKGIVRFRQQSDPGNDINIIFYNRDHIGRDGKMVAVGNIPYNSRRYGFIFTAFLTALILATPLSWRRKGRALFGGFFLIHCFIVLILGMWILYGFNKESLSLFVLNPFWNRVFLLAIDVFVRNLTFGLIVSVFIWILVSFRREDLTKFLIREKNPSKS
ncbi:MAG: hypothetical protein FVQ85_03195 [Planctomycetes bacterium]|nr:hypothetical protein [Planctomycetota bacterium]